MFFEIPLKNNFFNFTQNVNLGGLFYTLRFNYQNRNQTYGLDILSDNGEVLEAGLTCAIGVQLNRRILSKMRGVLFFQSTDSSLSYVDRLSLGTKVKLFYYLPDGV